MKAKPTTPKQPEEIELAHTGEDAMTRLTDFTRAIVTVPKSEIVEQEKQARKKQRH